MKLYIPPRFKLVASGVVAGQVVLFPLVWAGTSLKHALLGGLFAIIVPMVILYVVYRWRYPKPVEDK